jgi:hypothetical protein
MCVIAVKRSGVVPDIGLLRQCWDANPDGAGLAYRRSGKIVVHKGFMSFTKLERFIASHRSELTQSEVIFHFRIASVGSVEPALCHPFAVGQSHRALSYVTTSPVVFHNGHISALAVKAALEGLSDTALLVRDYLSPLAGLLDKPAMWRLLEIVAPGSRFAIMTPAGTYLIGTFEDGPEGWRFSNGSWRGWDWDDGDWDRDWDGDWDNGDGDGHGHRHGSSMGELCGLWGLPCGK